MFLGFSQRSWVSASRDHPARVSYLDGHATYEASGDVDWNELTLNLPLVSGDRIMARPDSRIEVELGDGNVVRISGETDIVFPELAKKKTVLKIHEGDLILRVKDTRGVLVELEQASVKIRKKGLYRIQVASRRVDTPGGPRGAGRKSAAGTGRRESRRDMSCFWTAAGSESRRWFGISTNSNSGAVAGTRSWSATVPRVTLAAFTSRGPTTWTVTATGLTTAPSDTSGFRMPQRDLFPSEWGDGATFLPD